MLIVMQPNATRPQIDAVCARISELGGTPRECTVADGLVIAVCGGVEPIGLQRLGRLEGVAQCLPVARSCKLVDRAARPEGTVVTVRGWPIGDGGLALIAGPCAVESKDQIFRVAEFVSECGVRFLRGGAYKPRSSPYAFQGLKEQGLRLLEAVGREFDLRIVTEVKDVQTLSAVAQAADVLQVGARNMQNFALLEAVGRLRKPVLLKRGMGATLNELYMAAEYVLSRGNLEVVLCERGIRTFETATRYTLDLSAVVLMKHDTHLPVVADPSHAVGIAWAVPPLVRAAVVAGADGVMVEVHPDPSRALSDGQQALTFDEFASLARDVRSLADWRARPADPRVAPGADHRCPEALAAR